MYVQTTLKCPDHDEWLAVTRVTPDGETISLGYLDPDCIPLVVATLKELHGRVADEGHPSWRTVDAWERFVNWAEVVAELGDGREQAT